MDHCSVSVFETNEQMKMFCVAENVLRKSRRAKHGTAIKDLNAI